MGPVYHKSPYRGREEAGARGKFEDATQLCLAKEEGTTRRGMQAASRKWGRQGDSLL